ncbi:MAG: transcriptional repressor LexA [Myxococcales bacterium]
MKSPLRSANDDELSDRQLSILSLIQHRIEEQGYPPTIREIGAEVGLRSTNGVAEHLRSLVDKGYLEKEDMKSRALGLTAKARAVTGASASGAPRRARGGERLREVEGVVEIPIVGRVAAGLPALAEENVEEVVRLDSWFLGGGRKVFALHVEGDSMIGDGIFDGDLVFVRQQETANPGEIVVAIIEGEATVKRWYPEKDRIRLQPSNPRMAPIYVRKSEAKRTTLAGIVVGVYRKLR